MNNKLGHQGALHLGRALMANRMSEDIDSSLDWVGLGGNDVGGEQDRRLKAVCYGLGPQPKAKGAGMDVASDEEDESRARALVLDMGEMKQAAVKFLQ